MWKISAPVVVGVDGSDAAINAAKWAIDEAISRDVPLRLVHVTHIEGQPAASEDEFRLEVQYAESSLRAATAAVEATGKHVKIETEILWGSPANVLINESRNASMVCVGSVGIGTIASELMASTAASLAENAYCPVAIIRYPHNPPASSPDWIAVVVMEDHAENEAVIELAMDEARLRSAPILAVGVWDEDFGEASHDELDRRIENWKKQYPDVHVHPVTSHASFARFLANKDESVQLAVVASADAASVAQIVGPHSHALVAHGECSVLVVH